MSGDQALNIPPILIEVTMTLELQPAEVWPDNNVPEDWTADDVLAEAMRARTFSRFNSDWNADTFGAEVLVSARGKYARGNLR